MNALLLLGVGCLKPTTQQPVEIPEPRPPLPDHAEAGADIVDGLLVGRLDKVRAGASAIPDLQHEGVNRTVEHLETSESLSWAASMTANLASECGACHADMAVTVDRAPPPTADHVAPHAEPPALLWHGLVWNDPQLFVTGAALLTGAKFDANGDNPYPEGLQKYRDEVRFEARRAASVNDRERQTELFGDMLDACVRCHRATDVYDVMSIVPRPEPPADPIEDDRQP